MSLIVKGKQQRRVIASCRACRGRYRFDCSHHPHEARLAVSDQHIEARGSWIRSTLRGARQQGDAAAGNVLPTEVTAWLANGISTDVPELFFLERYRQAYAAEMTHFVEALTKGTPVRTTIEDGVRALELAQLATSSWRKGEVLDVPPCEELSEELNVWEA